MREPAFHTHARSTQGRDALAPPSAAPPGVPPAGTEDVREANLLRLARAGDRDALQELLLDIQPRLHALCFRMCRDAERARDLCQESLTKIIMGLPEFSGRSRLSTWMIRITMNVCLTDRRREKLRAHRSLHQPEDAGGSDQGRTWEPASSEPSAAQRVERGEHMQRLSEALAEMDPEQRAILILRDLNALDYAELAEVLDLPVGTVKSRLFRARASLRALMEKNASPRPRP